MILLADIPTTAWQVVAAAVLRALGTFFLLPRPRGRSVATGVFLCIASAAVAAAYVVNRFGNPTADLVGQILFWLFSAGAVVFGAVLVAQRNPARGAMAFAFVILSTCGLFLLLAAPFLMAATVIIYAGAIIVTFLFVLMLSHAGGPSDENDRSREPLLGSLAGFAFAGLILFVLYLGAPASAGEERTGGTAVLPTPPLTPDDRAALTAAVVALDEAIRAEAPAQLESNAQVARRRLSEVVGYAPGESPLPPVNGEAPRPVSPTMQQRLRFAGAEPRVMKLIEQADRLRDRKKATFDQLDNILLDRNPNLEQARQGLRGLREEIVLLLGRGQLPSRNVSAIGYSLYSEHLVAVEMAGTLLLVATIGAVAIAQRRRADA